MVTSMSVCSLGQPRHGEGRRQACVTSLYDAPDAMGGVMGIMLLAVYETDDLDGRHKAPASMRKPDTKVPAGPTRSPRLRRHGDHGHWRRRSAAGRPHPAP